MPCEVEELLVELRGMVVSIKSVSFSVLAFGNF